MVISKISGALNCFLKNVIEQNDCKVKDRMCGSRQKGIIITSKLKYPLESQKAG